MALTGMDIEAVRQVGQQLQQKSDDINGIINALNSLVGNVAWVGPDADMFKNDWWPKHRGTLQAVAQELHGLGQSALNNAQEQENVSNH